MRDTRPERSGWRRLLRRGALAAVLVLVAGALFVRSGLYNVAASSDHWPFTTWLIDRVRVHSVDTWSSFVPAPPSLDDADLLALGAAHFEGGCTPCHSRPGDPANAIAAAMLPPPPPLGTVVGSMDAKALFWIVKHGLKYTAMPAWPAQQRDDEVWAVTAFLVRLPELSPRAYRELAGMTRTGQAVQDGAELATGSESVGLTECVRCHGDAETGPLSGYVPVLNAQPRRYLERALAEYADAQRPSGVMQPVATLLTPTERLRLAAWYAGLAAPREDRPDPAPGLVEEGRRLAREGEPGTGLPPCLACHARDHPESFPSLAGQNPEYLLGQLGLFRRGARDGTVHGQIMGVIARRLGDRQAQAAAAYFASLPAGGAPALAEIAP